MAVLDSAYIIRRSGTVAQAARTKHYIVAVDGSIAFILQGRKADQAVYRPRERGLRWHVMVYRSNRGHVQVKVYDMWTGQLACEWHDCQGLESLPDEQWLRQVLMREGVIEVV